MVVDIDKYSINREFIRKWLLDHQHDDIVSNISMMAVSTMCPCIVVAYWAGELFNWPTEIIETIERLKKFYGYTEIIGKPANSPI